jgi:hypothetical protein
MDQITAANKALEEARECGCLIPGSNDVLIRLFNMVYAIGYDEGRKSRSNQKAVIQMDKYGKFIKEFPSAAQAARETKIQHSDINKVCLGKGHTAGGFLWIYKSDYEQLHKSK